MQQARQLGRYQLLDRVAFGGMAEIYRGKTQDAEGRTHLVAVKRVLSHLCEDDEFIQMLVDEAKITAALQHENIARIYEFCRTEREYFIAMEYVDGKDVRAMLEKARQAAEMVPEEHVAWIGMEVARALHAAHTQRDKDGRPLRIVHRDVSPSNVLLSYRGDVKLCDFGIAKATLTRVQTKTGVIKGKVKYMSPEQAMGRKLDHRSDLFSLGTLLFEMLTLQAPFQAPTEIELIFAVRDARKRAAHELRQGLHPQLEAIIDKAMARSRSQRYQSGEEQAAALQEFLNQVYPGYRRSHFSRYMRNVFSKEIDRELRLLEDYVIEGGRAEEVGENLLADVLGPNAPYTQFTAAFVEGNRALLDLPTGARAMPPLSGSLAAGDMLSAEDDDVFITAARRRSSKEELEFEPVAQVKPEPVLEPEDEVPGIHEEQTRILTRAQIAMTKGASLHEAETKIFDLRSLPKEMRDVIRPGLPDLPGNAEPLPSLSGDIHEAATAYLPRSTPADLHLPGVQPERPRTPAAQPAVQSAKEAKRQSGELDGTTAPGDPQGILGRRANEVLEPETEMDLNQRADGSFSDLPTQLREDRLSSLRSGSLEISADDLSFLGGPRPLKPGETSEPSVVLDEEDIEGVE